MFLGDVGRRSQQVVKLFEGYQISQHVEVLAVQFMKNNWLSRRTHLHIAHEFVTSSRI
jgi:hypothetical protein